MKKHIMDAIQDLIQRFNRPDVHLVVSSWPDRHGGKTAYHGDAAFTRETLLTLVATHSMKFVVIAETNHNNEPELLARGNILVLRVIDHGKLHLYPTILSWLNRFPAIRHVTVHSNFTYSGLRHFVALIPFLTVIKATGRRISLVAHNVLSSITFLARQLDIRNPFLVRCLNIGVRFYNLSLGKIADDVIVLDSSGKEILSRYVPENNLVYTPHWVKKRPLPVGKEAAKRRLGIRAKTRVILVFGFISWYKGSDRIARLFGPVLKHSPGYTLIFAGGKSPTLSGKPHYDAYYERFRSYISRQPSMRLTEFLPDKMIPLYFASSDIVILPYRGLMGGSGVSAWTFGYGKPFLLSTPMKAFLSNPDIDEARIRAGLPESDILFPMTKKGVRKILHSTGNPALLAGLSRVSLAIREMRDIRKQTHALYTRIYDNNIADVKETGQQYALYPAIQK